MTPAAKHTPGPWTIDDRDRISMSGQPIHDIGPFFVLAPDDEYGEAVIVAEIQDDGEPGQALADTRLIAAAPELLAACERLTLGHPGFTDNHGRYWTLNEDERRAILAAIAKARGEDK